MTLLEKIAANRLGKEVLKKWLANDSSIAGQAFHNKVVSGLMAPKVNAKTTGLDRVKFMARGGDTHTGHVHIPDVRPIEVKNALKAKNAPKKVLSPQQPKSAAKPKPASIENNRYLKRVGIGAGIAGAAGAIGYGVKKLMNEDSFSKHK